MTDAIVANLQTNLFFPEHNVTKQGTEASNLYFLCRGRAEVFVKDNLRREAKIKNLESGSIFGEIGVIFDCKVTATVRTKNYCMIEALAKEKFLNIANQFREIKVKLKKQILEYDDPWTQYLLVSCN